MSIACRQFADYYQSLSAREKNILALNVQMHINLMLQLGGVEPVHSELSIDYLPEPVQFTNEYELQLQQAGINIDEIPEEFLCPISKQIMNNPTRVGYDTHWYTYDTATLQRLWADSGQSARCPFTNRPLSELTIEADTELEAKIKTWVEEKLESTKVKNVPK